MDMGPRPNYWVRQIGLNCKRIALEKKIKKVREIEIRPGMASLYWRISGYLGISDDLYELSEIEDEISRNLEFLLAEDGNEEVLPKLTALNFFRRLINNLIARILSLIARASQIPVFGKGIE